MNVARLIYRSIATADVVSNTTLRELEGQAATANAKAGISGLLILSGNVFLQVLEGDAAAVTALFGRIATDKRHRQVELLTFDASVPRCFEDWHMRLVDLLDLPGDKRAYMASKYRVDNDCIVVPGDVCQACALLLDARHLCLSAPWNRPDSEPVSDQPAA
ncbi:MAG: BLUF domain-containing protein [Gammaproteobacteria bacterium]|nr:BLUF domain-containing protein [Gammaproteobacteria bacterium]